VRVHQQPSYVLLNRPYSETSWIVEVFSRDFGRLALLAKGARRIKSKLKGVLMPFQPVLLSWTGKGELPILTSAEIDLSEYSLIDHELEGDALVCGFYCNELVVNLLHRHDPHLNLYAQYHDTIISLASAEHSNLAALALRDFEKNIIKETGYEVDFVFEADGKTKIIDSRYYHYQAGRGFLCLPGPQQAAFTGRVIKSLTANLPDTEIVYTKQEASQAKQLMRDILSKILGYKQIVSRELFYPKSR